MKQNGIRDADVAVLGGGPAGAATAIGLLERGYSTVVIERSDYGSARIGETLPPAVRPLLARLGVWDRFLAAKHSPSFGIRAAWGRDDLHDNDFIFNPYGAGWHVDRARFDGMLACRAEEAGAIVYRDARVLSCESDRCANWRIRVASGNRRAWIGARFLVDATGRAACAARKQRARRITWDRLIGVALLVPSASREELIDSSTLIEAAEYGWWYSAALPDSRLVLAYMTDADLYASGRRESRNYFLRHLERTRHTRSRLSACVLESEPRVVAADSSRLDVVAGRNWVAVGDAAMAFDPLSGQGVYKALVSAMRAALTVHEHLAGSLSALRDYAVAAVRDFDDYLLKRKTFYARERRFPGSIFWQRRIGSQMATRTAE